MLCLLAEVDASVIGTAPHSGDVLFTLQRQLVA